MPRKTPSTAPTVRQGDDDPDARAMETHLAQLDRLEANQRAQDTDEVEQLRQAWSPALSQAKTILAELSSLQAAYGPALQAIEGRDFSGLPPTGATLNRVARIERSCLELRQHLTHTAEDLKRIIGSIEGLSPRSMTLLLVNGEIYKQLLAMYRHTPQGVRELFSRLQYLVASLTEGMESATNEEGYTPLSRLPPPQMLTPQVEMA
jgi:hypothetical protein